MESKLANLSINTEKMLQDLPDNVSPLNLELLRI